MAVTEKSTAVTRHPRVASHSVLAPLARTGVEREAGQQLRDLGEQVRVRWDSVRVVASDSQVSRPSAALDDER
jgi:hypothetical protein